MTDPKKPTDPLELVGQQLLERYTLRERVASGGMSVVYRAQDERLKRPVCVKVFFGIDRERPEYRTHYEHFVQEAFALSQLQHPNTLRIYDFGYLEVEPRAPYYVSEYLDGGTLLQRVRKDGKLRPEQALTVLEPIVYALAEAHGRGIVHRDIKPSNILFGGPLQANKLPVPKLADFGIAKAHGRGAAVPMQHRAGDTMVQGGRISLYSPGWAAPEQMRAEEVGPTADVFSLGLLLAFAVSGQKAFPERDMLIAYSLRDGGDEVIRDALEALHLPRTVFRVCREACRAQPSERYPSAEAFLAALKESLQEPVTNPLHPSMEARTEETPLPAPKRPSKASPPVTSTSTPHPPPPNVFRVERLEAGELLAAGRRVRLVPIDEGPWDFGGEGGPMKQRLRLTFLEGSDRGRLHLKGLTSFICKEGGRPSSAVDLQRSNRVELYSANLEKLEVLDCAFGRIGEDGTVRFRLGDGELALPEKSILHGVLLGFGPDKESWLVFRASV